MRNALKLVANATGYGIFVQLDVNERSKPIAIHCYPATGPQFLVDMDKVEEPGEFFHPLVGTLITGAARLMLAITERLVIDSGLTWTFCDTDSMAIAKPRHEQGKFFKRPKPFGIGSSRSIPMRSTSICSSWRTRISVL